jgi:hypothetical protein
MVHAVFGASIKAWFGCFDRDKLARQDDDHDDSEDGWSR